MTFKTLTAILLAAGLASPALAQSAASDNATAKSPVIDTWDQDVRGSFFKDQKSYTLYPQEEAMGNFANLSDAQKERVRQECMTAPNTEINPADAAKERDQAFNTLCLWVRGEPKAN
ncbi:MAG: hypothetical protein AB7O39_07445 [Flavobacteriaceae bacterium]